MIVVTGAAGFIGSALVGHLHSLGYGNLIAVDDYTVERKKQNFSNKTYLQWVHRNQFPDWLRQNGNLVQIVIHIGARTDTAEFNEEILNELNLNYSKQLWKLCTQFSIPFLYASSAATYGESVSVFDDNLDQLSTLQPLNPYGKSKHLFDLWAIEQTEKPPFWAGFKFFNVYGPNEYHKGRMASVVFHAYHQIQSTQKMKLFRSHKPEYKDGWQLRDFVYVKDVCKVLTFFIENRFHSNIYNLGSGSARSFYDLASCVFQAVNKTPQIEFIDIPEDIRNKYQYYTKAELAKLRNVGYAEEFTPLELGIAEYVTQYLKTNTTL